MSVPSLLPNRFTAGALAALLACASTVPARGAVPAAVAAAAKSEGTVVWYSALEAPSLALVVGKFNAGHPGITVQGLQIGSTRIPARVMTEQSAGKPIADVVSGDLFSVSQLGDVGALAPLATGDQAAFLKGSFDPKGLWAALFSETTVIAWNPEKLKVDGLKPPATLADLAKPEWRGKLGVDGAAFNWYQAVTATQKDAADVLKRIADNRPLITNGHTTTVAQLANGEFDATPTVYGYMVLERRLAGAPVDFANVKPTLINLEPIAIVKNAPHPNAARVLVDWLLSREGQELIATTGHTSRRADVPGDPHLFNAKDPSWIGPAPERNEYNAMVSAYKALFGTGP